MSNLKPVGDRYMILPDEAETKIGNILLPETAQKPPNRGTIIGMADNVVKDQIKKGDYVLFSSYAANWVEHDGVKVAIVRQHDILAIL